jgi:hypothetical protein
MNGQMLDRDDTSPIFIIHNLLLQKAFKPSSIDSHIIMIFKKYTLFQIDTCKKRTCNPQDNCFSKILMLFQIVSWLCRIATKISGTNFPGIFGDFTKGRLVKVPQCGGLEVRQEHIVTFHNLESLSVLLPSDISTNNVNFNKKTIKTRAMDKPFLHNTVRRISSYIYMRNERVS